MGDKKEIKTVLAVKGDSLFKALTEAESALTNTMRKSDQLYDSFVKLFSYSVEPKSFELFTQSVQEASVVVDNIGEKLKQNFTPVIENPSFSEIVKAVDTSVKEINEKLKQFHMPSLGKMMSGEDSVFATINSNVDKVTQSFGGMAKSFGDKQKTMIAGMSNWKKNLTGFTENTKYQMKLFTMAMRTEGSPVDKIGKAFDAVSTKVTSGFSKIYESSGMMGSAFRSVGEGVNNAKTYLAELSENARYQMKLLSMHIRSEHPAIAEIGSKFSEMSTQVGGTLSSVSEKFGAFGSKIANSEGLKSALGGIGSSLQKSASVGTTAMTSMVQGLTSVFGFALKALGPAAILGVALAGFGLLDSQFSGQIGNMIKTATTKGPEIIGGFIQGIIDKLPALMETGTQLVAGLAEALAVNLPVIMQSAVNLINALVQGVIESLPTLIPAALMLIESLATSLLSAAPQLLLTGLSLLLALVDGILANKDQIITTVTNIIQSFTENVTNKLPEIIQKGVEILTKLAEGIASVLPKLIPVALEAITTLVGTLLEQLPTLIDAAIKIVGALCKGLWDSLPDILLAAGKLLMTFIGGIIDILPDVATAGWKVANEIIKAITEVDLFEIGGNIIKGLTDGIVKGAKTLWDELGKLTDKVKGFFTGGFKIHSPSRWMRDEIGAMLPAGLAIGIERNANVVDQSVDSLTDRIQAPILAGLDVQYQPIQTSALSSSSYQQSIEPAKQPATFNIRLGKQQFQAFVGDISEAMGTEAEINLAF